jgi:hypothetical protein
MSGSTTTSFNPTYLHPSVASQIIDNSTVFVTAAGTTVLFAAFGAPSGPDNQIQAVSSPSEFAFYYGAPNMRSWGQTAYNVNNWLLAGGSALCMRVLPYLPTDSNGNPLQQSLYAMSIIEVGTKTTGGVKTLKVRTRILGDGTNSNIPQSVELGVRTDADINAVILAAPTAPDTGDGYTYYPIMAVRGDYRGAYANQASSGGYGITLQLLTSNDNTYEFRTYQLTIFNGPGSVIESFVVSTYPEAANVSGQSMYLPSVLATYSDLVTADFSEANYDSVVSFINANASVAQEIDIFTLTERNVSPAQTLHAGVSLASGSEPLVPLDSGTLPLGGGTDGDWVGPNSLDSLLYSAYAGTGDYISPDGENLYDTHFSDAWNMDLYPMDITLDANYPYSVKTAMANFATNRGDLMAMLDLGFTASPSQAIANRSGSLPINTFYAAIFSQDFIVTDTGSNAQIQVTAPYFLASKIPTVDNAYGIQYPFVGPRRGTIAGFISQSWIPDEASKESLYDAQINYVETTTSGSAFMSQLTSQINNSALSNISCVRVLLRIRRDLTALGGTYRFEFNDATTYSSFQYSANQYLQTWLSNRALTSATAVVYASAYDIQSKIVRLNVTMVFNGIIERVAISLIVNS